MGHLSCVCFFNIRNPCVRRDSLARKIAIRMILQSNTASLDLPSPGEVLTLIADTLLRRSISKETRRNLLLCQPGVPVDEGADFSNQCHNDLIRPTQFSPPLR